MEKEDFKLGEYIQSTVYDYDDQGIEYSRQIRGRVRQITDHFVTLDNGIYKESFNYCSFKRYDSSNLSSKPYDLSVEGYFQDVVEKCVEDIRNSKQGIVFNKTQLNKVGLMIDLSKYDIKEQNEIYYINMR